MLRVNRIRDYISLMRLDKPIGIFLLLWPALWALLIAGEGDPDSGIVLIFILGVVLMRSAGCVINDYADRDIDRHVSRTRNRPLTAGRVTVTETLFIFALLCGAAFLLVLQLNRLTVLLSFVGIGLAVVVRGDELRDVDERVRRRRLTCERMGVHRPICSSQPRES